MKAIPRRSRVGMVLVVVTALVLIYMQQAALAAVAVTPSSNLPASANVNVSGNGFAANQPGTIFQCKFNPGLGADECKQIGLFTTNASGNFGPVPVTVTSTYVSSDNTNVNCAVDAAANPCRVQAALNNVFGQQEAPISFAGSTTTSSSTSTSTSSTSTSIPLVPTCDGKTATIVGTPGNDRIFGTPGDDVIVGAGGGDSIQGLGGNDTICGNDGNDQIDGGAGNDRLFGGNDSDRVLGGPGNNALFGEGGADQCFVTPTSTAATCEQVLPQP